MSVAEGNEKNHFRTVRWGSFPCLHYTLFFFSIFPFPFFFSISHFPFPFFHFFLFFCPFWEQNTHVPICCNSQGIYFQQRFSGCASLQFVLEARAKHCYCSVEPQTISDCNWLGRESVPNSNYFNPVVSPGDLTCCQDPLTSVDGRLSFYSDI